MFNGAVILTYSKYFLDCPRPYLTGAQSAKGVSIRGIFISDISVWGIFVESFCDDIDVELCGMG